MIQRCKVCGYTTGGLILGRFTAPLLPLWPEPDRCPNCINKPYEDPVLKHIIERIKQSGEQIQTLSDKLDKETLMKTRCKFRCASVTSREDCSYDSLTGTSHKRVVYDAKFYVVCDNGEENKNFFASTPAGEVSLSTLRSDHFVPGHEYYLDFTPAE